MASSHACGQALLQAIVYFDFLVLRKLASKAVVCSATLSGDLLLSARIRIRFDAGYFQMRPLFVQSLIGRGQEI
ncbi:hypothetical protein [Pseudomonas capsici]|uniref:hypothetical protein n=1 Tax=Pseudomonas capsici TaxID=2810614 RepID=UPI0021F103CC|nr:hypothetical protein [Pseudomonas capsici]MCV4341519.1 hypothetical protein [Pseudomonas capsici]